MKNKNRYIWFAMSASIKPGFFFKAISWFIKRPFSHSFMFYYDNDLRDFVVTHADKGSVHTMILKDFLVDRTISLCWSILVDEHQRISFIRSMHTLDGESYSFPQIAGILFAKIARLKKNPFRNMTTDGDEDFICSEYFDRQLEAIDIIPSYEQLKIGRDLVTPADNADHMMYLVNNEPRVRAVKAHELLSNI